jgi:hypothetical protein
VNLPLLFVNCIARGGAEIGEDRERTQRRERLDADAEVLAFLELWLERRAAPMQSARPGEPFSAPSA